MKHYKPICRKDWYTASETAHIVWTIGSTKGLHAFLRKHGIIQANMEPYAKYRSLGIFKVEFVPKCETGDSSSKCHRMLFISQAGIDFIVELLEQQHRRRAISTCKRLEPQRDR